ncbi:MAG: HAD-IA family hydrolase [Acidobacteria bacterium]|nr:HAD-IA family hydrolase [Acidobacteriota bacterium]
MIQRIEYVIFDNDGLLLDTEPFYTRAHGAVAARFGKVFDWTVKSRMIGLRAEDSARVVIEGLGLPLSVPEYLEARQGMLDELFPQTEPMPGAVRLSRHLHRHGIPMAVATSSDRRHFELKITRHREWFRIFSSVVTGDDPAVGRGKPAPDIFLLAARTVGADPGRCLVFEDSPAGVAAALAAGMYVVAVPDPHLDEAACDGAHQVLRSLEEVNLPAWGLPPFPEEA